MKAKLRISLILALICSMMLSVAAAEETAVNALPGTGWVSGINVQNVGTDVAQIDLTGYARTDGTAAAPQSAPNIPVGNLASFNSYPAGATSFDGSGIVSSNQPIVAVVNVANGPGGLAAGQYQGTDGARASTTLSFPVGKNGPVKCTTFYVQNAGTGAATVDVAYSTGATTSFSIANPGQTYLFDPTALASGAIASVVMTSNQPLAGTSLEYKCGDGSILQATRGLTPADEDSVLYAPLYKANRDNRATGLTVQNVSDGPVDIEVTFTCDATSAQNRCDTFTSAVHTATNVAPGDNAIFFRNNVIANGTTTPAPSGQAIPNGSLTAATVRVFQAGTTTPATGVGVVNESFLTLPGGVADSQTQYAILASAEAGSRISLPLYKEMFDVKTSGLTIQNITASPVTVRVVYNMNNGAAACRGTFTLENVNIAANAAVTLFRPALGGATTAGGTWAGGNAIQEGCFGGATVEVTSASGVVMAVGQEADLDATPAARQDAKNYESFVLSN